MSSTLDLSIALVSFTLAAPVAYIPHFGFMLPVLWVALLAVLKTGWRLALALGLLAFAYVLSGHFYIALNSLADTGWNFLQSTSLFAALALLAVLYGLRGAALRSG